MPCSSISVGDLHRDGLTGPRCGRPAPMDDPGLGTTPTRGSLPSATGAFRSRAPSSRYLVDAEGLEPPTPSV